MSGIPSDASRMQSAESTGEGRLRYIVAKARRPGYSGSLSVNAKSNANPQIDHGSGSASGSSRTVAPHAAGHREDERGSDSLVASRPSKEEVAQAYERFRKLGMPTEITAEVFEHLIIGSPLVPSSDATGATKDRPEGADKIGAAILLLSKRLVGRQEAARVRGVIANAREEATAEAKTQLVSKIKAPSASYSAVGGGIRGSSSSSMLEDPMRSASVRRDNAYRGLVGAKKEYEEARQEMLALDAEKRKLEEEMLAKRRLALLMDILKKKETARLARFTADGGLGAMLDDLRKTAQVVMKEHDTLVAKLTSEISENALHDDRTLLQKEAMIARRKSAWKYRHSTEALANLHALHIRRTRSAEMKEHSASVGSDVGARLDQMADRLGIHDADEKEQMKQKLIEVARKRLDRKDTLRWTIQGECIDDINLDDRHRAVVDKERLVQEKINRAAAIGWLCQEYIDMTTLFRTETASALQKMLDEERRRVDSYIELARDALLKPREKMKAKENQWFAHQVRDIIGTGRHSYESILEDVKNMVEMVQISQSMVDREYARVGKAGDRWVGSRSEERNRRLLERKGSKIDYGLELGEEIRTLLADSKRLK